MRKTMPNICTGKVWDEATVPSKLSSKLDVADCLLVSSIATDTANCQTLSSIAARCANA